MNKKIVLEPSADIRRLARQALRGYWKTAVLAVLLLEIVQKVPMIFITALFPSGAVDMVVQVYSLLVGGPLALGIIMVYLNIFRRKQTGPLEVFYGFEYMFKAIGLQLVIGIFTLLWSLLLIIPGIIAAYRYSLSFYIMADDPSKGIMQCISESKYLMAGNKEKMFCLDFSFIGWSLLCAIPVSVFTGVFMFNNAYDMLISGTPQFEIVQALRAMPAFNIGVTIAGLGNLFLYPYMNVATTCLYDLINGNLTVRRVVNGGQPMGGMPYDPNGMNQGMQAPGQGQNQNGPFYNTTPPYQNGGWNNQNNQNNQSQPGQPDGNWNQGTPNGNWRQPGQPDGNWNQPGQPDGNWNQGTQNGNWSQPGQNGPDSPQQSIQQEKTNGSSGAVDLRKPQENGIPSDEQRPE